MTTTKTYPIRFRCESCSANLKATSGGAGKFIVCPKCKGETAIPHPTAEPVEPIYLAPEPKKSIWTRRFLPKWADRLADAASLGIVFFASPFLAVIGVTVSALTPAPKKAKRPADAPKSFRTSTPPVATLLPPARG